MQKKLRCARAKDFQEEYPIGIHCIWEAAGNRRDQTSVPFFSSSAAIMHLARLLWLSKWQFCFCTIIHWILTCYQVRVECNGFHKTSNPPFWTLPVHQAPRRLIMFRTWEFLLVQERSSMHWATWNGSPSLCQQVADGYSLMLWNYTTKESHPTQLLQHAASYLPFPDLAHRVLQVDILIKGALAWEWEEIVRGHCFSVRMGYRCRSPTCETWHL